MGPPESVVVYNVVTGFTLQIPDDASIIVFESATTLTCTLILPMNPSPDMKIQIGTRRSITAMTMSPGQPDQTIINGPTAQTGGTGVTMIYNQPTNTWYRLA